MSFSEETYVKDTYNKIAKHFSGTRYKAWSPIIEFLDELKRGFICEVGCGNGKNFCNPKHFYVGCDLSQELIKEVPENNERLVCSGIKLPYRENVFDATMSIAVIHHLNTFERRKLFLQQLIKITKKGGSILYSGWVYDKKDKKRNEIEKLVKWNDRTSGKVYYRYYHFFTLAEWIKLARTSNIRIKKIWYIKQNYFCELVKD